MSFKEWFVNVRILHDNIWYTITPHNIKVVKSLTEEPWYAEIKWVDNGELGNTIEPDTIYCGDTIEIYSGTIATDLELLFRGRIYNIGEEYSSLDKGIYKFNPERYIEAYRGKILQDNERYAVVPADYDRTQFVELAEDAKNNGLIAGYTIWVDNGIRRCRKRSGKRSYWELLREIAEDADWDFYVDNDNTLHIFPRQHSIYPGSIVPKFVFKTEYDATNIINSIEIYGAAQITIGSDSEYTENTINWEGYNLTKDTEVRAVGTVSIRASSTGTVALKRQFDSTLDLSTGGMLHFRYKYWAEGVTSDTRENSLRIEFYTDSNNYFQKEIGVAGGRVWRIGNTGAYQFQFSEINIGFNIYDEEGYNIIGSPKWENISSLAICVIYPVGSNNTLWIDDMYFQQMQIVSRKGDDESISKYGLRKGPSLNDGNIYNAAQADAIADVLLALYSKPRLIIEGLRTEDTFQYPLGYRCTVALHDKKVVGEIRRITYTFDGKMLTEELDISQRYIPKPERALGDLVTLMRKVNWNVDLFRKLFSDQVLVDIPTELIDWNRVTSMFPYEDWYNVKKIAITGEGGSSGWKKIEETPGCCIQETIYTGDIYLYSIEKSAIYSPLKLSSGTLWFRTRMKLETLSNLGIIFGNGEIQWDPTFIAVPMEWVGFSISPNTILYAQVGTLDPYAYPEATIIHSHPIATLNIGVEYDIEYRCYSGNSIVWYLNQVPKSTLTNYQPSSTLKEFYVYWNGGPGSGGIRFGELEWAQGR